MGFALQLALRYLLSRKSRFISLSTVFAMLGVALGTAALVVGLSVTGGFRQQFQKKVLGVNGHVIVLRSPFDDYRFVIGKVQGLPGVLGVSPFVINQMMLTHQGRSMTGVTLKGVDPHSVGSVLDLPEQIVEGGLQGLAYTRPANERQRAAQRLGLSLRSARDAGPPPMLELEVGRDLPPGSIVPEGGYASVLPHSDDIPAEVDPDPCQAATGELPGIVVGQALKQALGLHVGACLQVTSPIVGYAFAAGELRPPVLQLFRVVAVFHAGFEQYDSKFAYTNLSEAQALYSQGDSVTGVEVKVADVDAAGAIAQRIDEELGNRLYTVIDWMELNHGLFTSLRIQQLLMGLVLGLITVVATFTVVGTLSMLVLSKKREIAAIKAMGASDAQVLRTFVYQGIFIGAAGTGGGLSFGYVLCRWILTRGFSLDPKVYFIDRLPVLLRTQEFALTGAFAMLACVLATLWPALHAARLRPVDAFRGT
jgi:lipoprotein-releasing system permease protein